MEEAQAYQFSWTGQNWKKLNYKIEVIPTAVKRF
jgi:hypothetical protein